MKIIPKIVLYAAIIALYATAIPFFYTLDKKADSQVGSPKSSAIISKSRVKAGVVPYRMSDKIKIKNPIYIEKITLKSNLELDH